MADTKPAAPRKDGDYTVRNDSGGAIPRMGLNIPMPASTKPPPSPSQHTSAKPAGQK